MNIIFDLDGTLICSKKRLYLLFDALVDKSCLSFDQYWVLKYSRLSNRDILEKYFRWSDQQILSFEREWMNAIEDESYLVHDKPIGAVIPFLRKLSAHNNLYVCTARQSEQKTLNQLASLGFNDIFTKVMVTSQKRTKEELILENLKFVFQDDWIIGDTGKDVQTGKALKINTCAVLTGFMNEHNLAGYSPDRIILSVTDFEV